MTNIAVAIIGAGPYGLSLAAHLGTNHVEHRIFGRPMQFWSAIAQAGGQRYLKSYCFGTNISTPRPGFTFENYSKPRGLETFEPCSIADFAAYGHWFQEHNVPWVEQMDVMHVRRHKGGFILTLEDGSSVNAYQVVVATGLSCFAQVPSVLKSLPPERVTHTSGIASFAKFQGLEVAVVGAGQSALEAAALLYEAGAHPQLLIRENQISWMSRISQTRSVWRRVRSPISGLGTGPKAWALTHFPGMLHEAPSSFRVRFVKNHLPPEGAWWLRERVENRVPVHLATNIQQSQESGGRVALRVGRPGAEADRRLVVDHVIAGSGYAIDVARLEFLDPELRRSIKCIEQAPRLNQSFESSVTGLRFIGPTSAMSFGPLFRFVVGADYTARTIAAHLRMQRRLTA